MLPRHPTGAGTPVDGPQPHDAHQPLHPLPAYHHPPSLQSNPHAPRPVERGLPCGGKGTLPLKAEVCFLRPFDISQFFPTATVAIGSGARLSVSYLS